MNKKLGLNVEIDSTSKRTEQADSREDTTKRSRINDVTIKRFHDQSKKYRRILLVNSKFLVALDDAIRLVITTRLDALGRFEKWREIEDDAGTSLSRLEEARDAILFEQLNDDDDNLEDPVLIDERELELRELIEEIEETREHELEMEWGIKNIRTTTAVIEGNLKLRKIKHEALNSRLCEKITTIERHLMSQSGTDKLNETSITESI